MANTVQARKRARQAEKRRQRNASNRTRMRTSIKKVVQAIEAGEKENAATAYKAMSPLLDHLAGSGLIHKNKAARYKSRLNAQIKALAA